MKKEFASLDRHTILECEYDQPDRYRQLIAAAAGNSKLITRGAGVSYAGGSFSKYSRSIDVSRFDRILSFDADRRLIEVEAGVSLGKLFQFLTPRGFHLPVQPGHPQVTIGGCIAANVHGKNQFAEGVFGGLVEKLELFHPDHGKFHASASENPDVFELTIGGYGLTGVILSAQLRLLPLPGWKICESRVKVRTLNDGFRELNRLKADYDMIYCWIDLAATGKQFGRGFIVAGKFIQGGNPPELQSRYKQLDPSTQRRFRPTVFSDAAMPQINRIYYYQKTLSKNDRPVPLFNFLFPAVGNEFFFDFFGPRGLIEQQVLLPYETIDAYLDEFIPMLRRHGRPVALATIKAFQGRQDLLHFNGTGFNFTIEVRNTPENVSFLNSLDELNCRFKGITNIIKDSRLKSDIIKRQYPAYEEFRERLDRYDPARRFSSSISERLAL